MCECGCGTSFHRLDSKRRPRRYVVGHNTPVHLMERIESTCLFCGTKWLALPWKVNAGEAKYCSRSCKSKAIGRKLSSSNEYKEKMRQITKRNGNIPPFKRGKDHWNWKGGLFIQSDRNNTQYVQWRKDILASNGWTCELCGKRGVKLTAHHIYPWATNPDLRFSVFNGSCLCYSCHSQAENRLVHNNKECCFEGIMESIHAFC